MLTAAHWNVHQQDDAVLRLIETHHPRVFGINEAKRLVPWLKGPRLRALGYRCVDGPGSDMGARDVAILLDDTMPVTATGQRELSRALARFRRVAPRREADWVTWTDPDVGPVTDIAFHLSAGRKLAAVIAATHTASQRVLVDLIRERLTHGHVVVHGDANHPRPPVLLAALAELGFTVHHTGVDLIAWSPGLRLAPGTRVTTVPRAKGGTDHEALVAHLTAVTAPVVTPPKPTQPTPAEPQTPSKEPPVSTRVTGNALTPQANKVIAEARKHVGYREGSNNDNKFARLAGHLNHFAWCATFLRGVMVLAGLDKLIPTGQAMAGCDQLFGHFKKIGRWSEYPAVGALFFTGTRADLSHTGLVVAYDDDWIYTVEGNTNDDGSRNGNGVYARQRARRGSSVVCYAYPDYAEGILSADPAWKKAAPKKTAQPKASGKPAGKSPRWDALVNLAEELRDSLPKDATERRDDLEEMIHLGSRWSFEHGREK